MTTMGVYDQTRASRRPRSPPSRLKLAHHRVRPLDVAEHARSPRPVVAVRREGLLVGRRERGGHALLDLLERGAGRHLPADGLYPVVQIGAEGPGPVPARDAP